MKKALDKTNPELKPKTLRNKDGKGLAIIASLISLPYASILLYNLLLHSTMHTDSSSDAACGICFLLFFLIYICGIIGLTSFIGNITAIILYKKDKNKKKWFRKLLNVLNWISVLLYIACIIIFVSTMEW